MPSPFTALAPRIEGTQAMAGMQTPITFYTPAIAPSGASFYRGTRFPPFVNNLHNELEANREDGTPPWQPTQAEAPSPETEPPGAYQNQPWPLSLSA